MATAKAQSKSKTQWWVLELTDEPPGCYLQKLHGDWGPSCRATRDLQHASRFETERSAREFARGWSREPGCLRLKRITVIETVTLNG